MNVENFGKAVLEVVMALLYRNMKAGARHARSGSCGFEAVGWRGSRVAVCSKTWWLTKRCVEANCRRIDASRCAMFAEATLEHEDALVANRHPVSMPKTSDWK